MHCEKIQFGLIYF